MARVSETAGASSSRLARRAMQHGARSFCLGASLTSVRTAKTTLQDGDPQPELE
jgi:hypothetical protein